VLNLGGVHDNDYHERTGKSRRLRVVWKGSN
jgi:hypothetical protein